MGAWLGPSWGPLPAGGEAPPPTPRGRPGAAPRRGPQYGGPPGDGLGRGHHGDELGAVGHLLLDLHAGGNVHPHLGQRHLGRREGEGPGSGAGPLAPDAPAQQRCGSGARRPSEGDTDSGPEGG